MIKICHMTSAHKAEDLRIFFNECVSLANAGYETYIVAQGESYIKHKVHIEGIGPLPNKRLTRMLRTTKQVYQRALEIDADIYHFHDPELLPYGLKLKKKGKKVIFDSHENTVDQIMEKTWIPSIFRFPLYAVFDRYQKYVCKQLDVVVSVTPHICDYFRKVNPATYMITNYPVLKPMPARTGKNQRSLCFAGGISSQWCHREIIQAMEQVHDCTYFLCGAADTEYFQSLTKLPGWNRVRFLNRIPHEQVHQLLGDCCVGMSVLKYNRNTGGKTGTMGNTKIFEEMMAGLPVVCTDFVLWREFVDRYHCGICVDPENADAIAKAIRYLLDHPDEARQMGENGRRAVEEEFNWGVEEQKLLALYQDVLEVSR